MEAYSHPPDIATCIGCGVDCGVVGDFGLDDFLCRACQQAQIQWDAERTISDATAIILARGPFAGLSLSDRQELLNQFFADIGHVPEAVNADEAESWLNPPQFASPAAFHVHILTSKGSVFIIDWPSLESAKASVNRLRADGLEAVIDGHLY